MEFLSNPIWQLIVNAAIGLCTIIVTIIIFSKQFNRRSITYEVISDTPMLSLKEEVKARVQVLFDTKPVGDVYFVILKMWNSGNTPILPTEYIDPIRFDFGEKAEVLDTDVLETVPRNIKDKVKAALKLEAGTLILEPLLLNSRDSITLKFLYTRTKLTREIKVDARIVGINQILNFDMIYSSHPIGKIIAICSIAVFIMSVIYFLFSKYENNSFVKLFYLFLLLLMALLYILLIILLVSIAYSFKYKLSLTKSTKIVMNKSIDIIKYFLYETV